MLSSVMSPDPTESPSIISKKARPSSTKSSRTRYRKKAPSGSVGAGISSRSSPSLDRLSLLGTPGPLAYGTSSPTPDFLHTFTMTRPDLQPTHSYVTDAKSGVSIARRLQRTTKHGEVYSMFSGESFDLTACWTICS